MLRLALVQIWHTAQSGRLLAASRPPPPGKTCVINAKQPSVVKAKDYKKKKCVHFCRSWVKWFQLRKAFIYTRYWNTYQQFSQADTTITIHNCHATQGSWDERGRLTLSLCRPVAPPVTVATTVSNSRQAEKYQATWMKKTCRATQDMESIPSIQNNNKQKNKKEQQCMFGFNMFG